MTLFLLFLRHIDGRPLLAYERRRKVPWSAVPPILLLGMMLTNSAGGFFMDSSDAAFTETLPAQTSFSTAAVVPAPQAVSLAVSVDAAFRAALDSVRTDRYIHNVWIGVVVNLALFAILHGGLAVLSGADRRDLGWPEGRGQLFGDVFIGVVACLAALTPVYLVQVVLVQVFQPKQGHPLIESFVKNPSAAMALAAGVSAVVAAPLFEETAFRLVFQGWLEKWTAAMAPTPTSAVAQSLDQQMQSDPPLMALNEVRFPAPSVDLTAQRPPGWAPVFISGVLFGLAHWGHGVAPVSLVLLGFVLGYIYQRTHRIVPCIVCHMLFNAFSLAMLWLQLNADPDEVTKLLENGRLDPVFSLF